LRRSAVSIPSNIAEGFERGSKSEFRHFLSIAKGSCGELKTLLYIAHAINYISNEEAESLIEKCRELCSMIYTLMSHIKK
jgi:four helix bundle protein